jgi:hypothetical protein
MTTITLILSLLLSALDGTNANATTTNGTSSSQTQPAPQQGTDWIITEEGMP